MQLKKINHYFIVLILINIFNLAFAKPLENKGSWTFSNQMMVAKLPAISGQTTTNQPIYLIVSCNQGKFLVGIKWGGYLKRGVRVPIDLKFDHDAISSESWRVYNETDTTYTDNPVQLFDKLSQAKLLTVRSSKINDGIVNAIFNLDGAKTILAPLKNQCSQR